MPTPRKSRSLKGMVNASPAPTAPPTIPAGTNQNTKKLLRKLEREERR